MKKRKLKIIILSLVIIEGVFIYLNYKSYNRENTQVFNEVKIADNLKETKQIAIMQQKEDFTWEDKGTSASAWPDIKIFEYYGSECTDASGNNITPTTDVIQFDEQNQTATISTSKTIYCTLKFARRSKVLELMTKTTDGTYLKTYDGKTAMQLEQGETTEDELLRYVGTQTDVSDNKLNNFICFGTENKDTCLGDKETYIYRIIGITTSNIAEGYGVKDQLKIIKASKYGENYDWGVENSSTKWNNALLQTYLNTESSDFLKTIKDITTKVGIHNWIDLITTQNWYMEYQGTNYSWPSKNPTPQSISEGAWSGRIGLMYASDYVNAYQDNSRDNWLFIKNGMSGNRAEYEWTMSRYGYYYDPYISGYDAWSMNDGGKLYTWSMNLSCAVRPVFYLTRDISISGEGTESDPFIISDKIVS